MAISSLPRAQSVKDLTRTHRQNRPKSGGARASAAAIENWDSIFRLIMARLRLTVGEHDPVPSTSPEGKALRRHLCMRPSIGIAIYSRDGTSAEALLMNAEFAMYRAKQHGTGYAFVDEQ